jgi:predicted nuclease of predicted toxin-antitoxin system
LSERGVRWLVDECVDVSIVVQLRRAGHDVVYMSDAQPRATDTEVLERAHKEDRLLLTEDKDFGELVIRQAKPVPGVILLRISPERRALKSTRLRAAVDLFGDALIGRYTVVEETRFRSRRLAELRGK